MTIGSASPMVYLLSLLTVNLIQQQTIMLKLLSRTVRLFLLLAAVTSSAPINDVTDTGILTVTGLQGSTVSLPCLQNNLEDKTVSWIREKDLYLLTVGEFTYTSDMRFEVAANWALRIKDVQPKDSAQYYCQTTHEPPRTYYVKLIVTTLKAEILMDGEPNVKAGSKLTLNCITGQTSVTPPFSWYHNGSLLTDGGRSTIRNVVGPKDLLVSSQLTILSITPADAGKYSCLPEGGEVAFVDIAVTDLPSPPSSLHVTGVTFSSVEITWSYGDDEEQDGQSHYVLRYRPDHSDEDYTEITDISASSYNVNGLMPMAEYAFQVLAVKTTGERGPPSSTLLVTTATLSFSLLRAVENGHLSVVKDLLELDADIDEGDGMYLKMAAQMGHLEVVDFLLDAGADPDADEDGEAVQEAAKNGHIEVVRALLEAGADANVGDGMHHAVAGNRPEIVKLLHQYGSDVNKPLPEKPWKDPETGVNYGFGWTALHVAARWGQTSMIDLLYHLGSDLASKDPKGDTPLHVAVKYPQIWFVREILKFCPDLTLQNNDGKTVVDLVEDLPHAIYSSLSSKEGIKLRQLVANITLDKIKTSTNTEEAAAALEDEVETLVESNATISDLVDAVASTDSHVDIVLQELFEDTIYLEIEDAFADHLCTSDGSGEWRAELDVEYAAKCVCVPGKGPTLELKPLDQSEGVNN